MMEKWGWWWEKRDESWWVADRRSFVCVCTCCCNRSSSRIYKSMSMWGEERVSKEEAGGSEEKENLIILVFRGKLRWKHATTTLRAKDAERRRCSRGFAATTTEGRKDETRQKPNDPRHQQHTSTGVASSTTTRHPLTLIDTRTHFQCPPVVWMLGMDTTLLRFLFYFIFFCFFLGAVTFFFFFRFCDVARWRSFNSRFNHIWLFTKYRKVKKKNSN